MSHNHQPNQQQIQVKASFKLGEALKKAPKAKKPKAVRTYLQTWLLRRCHNTNKHKNRNAHNQKYPRQSNN